MSEAKESEEKKCEKLTGVIDAKWLAIEVGGIIYKQGKAKVFNVLESQIENDKKLRAAMLITQDILRNIARDVSDLIQSTLGDWKEQVEVGGEVSDEVAREAIKEYEEVKDVLRIQ